MQVNKIVEQMDGLISSGRGAEAQALLEQGIRRAMEEKDDAALLTLLNEMIGYTRETSRVEDSYRYADAALALMEQMGIGETTAYATTLLNIANAYRAGGRLADSLARYEEVIALYEKQLDQNDMLFASLYNNISLLYQEMGDFSKAKESELKALAIVKQNDDVYFEEAVTCANLAASCLQLGEDDTAAEYFEHAISIFETRGIRDSHYAAALSSMGTFYYRRRDFERAADCFERAMAAVKDSLGENEYYHRLAENLAACRHAVREEPLSGLALCRLFYEKYGKPMLEAKFSGELDKIAVGLVGEGSDCFGFDDKISRDHDWGPGFAIWISEETDAKIGDALRAAYDALPKEFMGAVRMESPQGKGRVGVCTVRSFYERILGAEHCRNLTKTVTAGDFAWADLSDEALAAATNGEVFYDGEGVFSAIRRVLREGCPERLWYLKLAEACAKFSQALPYNYERMSKRGDSVAALLAKAEGLRQAMKLVYYMDGEYPPHDKWLYAGIAGKQDCGQIADILRKLGDAGELPGVGELTEMLGGLLADRLYEKDYVGVKEPYLAYYVPELLEKAALSEESIEELAQKIAKEEFAAFDKVRNEGGRASCQNDWYTFSIMRRSQYLTWSKNMLLQYFCDFRQAEQNGRNLIEEKYGRMMESTAPERYAEIADRIPAVPEEKKQIIEAIVQIQVGFMEAFAARYPHLAANARTIHTYDDREYDTSYETYLRGELGTYSDKMLTMYGRFVVQLAKEGKNLAEMTMENSARLYGYESLEAAEEKMPL